MRLFCAPPRPPEISECCIIGSDRFEPDRATAILPRLRAAPAEIPDFGELHGEYGDDIACGHGSNDFDDVTAAAREPRAAPRRRPSAAVPPAIANSLVFSLLETGVQASDARFPLSARAPAIVENLLALDDDDADSPDDEGRRAFDEEEDASPSASPSARRPSKIIRMPRKMTYPDALERPHPASRAPPPPSDNDDDEPPISRTPNVRTANVFGRPEAPPRPQSEERSEAPPRCEDRRANTFLRPGAPPRHTDALAPEVHIVSPHAAPPTPPTTAPHAPRPDLRAPRPVAASHERPEAEGRAAAPARRRGGGAARAADGGAAPAALDAWPRGCEAAADEVLPRSSSRGLESPRNGPRGRVREIAVEFERRASASAIARLAGGAATPRHHALDALRHAAAPSGVDLLRREDALAPQVFKECFGIDRAAFDALPTWRRVQLKRENSLF
ncbi:hypothetical protein M885DRAFT_540781 [Pelagophyceae sp. CCMP2097]|nr:hypothetical protein M885DRAFT_540781 [Pelagophyceae sp. CCMP2097]